MMWQIKFPWRSTFSAHNGPALARNQIYILNYWVGVQTHVCNACRPTAAQKSIASIFVRLFTWPVRRSHTHTHMIDAKTGQQPAGLMTHATIWILGKNFGSVFTSSGVKIYYKSGFAKTLDFRRRKTAGRLNMFFWSYITFFFLNIFPYLCISKSLIM